MQRSTNQYDAFSGFPRAQAGAGCRRRTIAPGHRRHSSPRCSCRVGPPICDAWLIGLTPGVATQAGARPRTRPSSTCSWPSAATATAMPGMSPRRRDELRANVCTLRPARLSCRTFASRLSFGAGIRRYSRRIRKSPRPRDCVVVEAFQITKTKSPQTNGILVLRRFKWIGTSLPGARRSYRSWSRRL